jgi:PmbA protein
VRAEPDVREAEVFVASNAHMLTRLSYTSHIPCNGVEEPKSTSGHGLGLQVVFDHPEAPRVGFGSEARDLGPEGARRALARARAAAVPDPHFVSLPRPTGEPRSLEAYHDPDLMSLSDDRLVEAGWNRKGRCARSSRRPVSAGSRAPRKVWRASGSSSAGT